MCLLINLFFQDCLFIHRNYAMNNSDTYIGTVFNITNLVFYLYNKLIEDITI